MKTFALACILGVFALGSRDDHPVPPSLKWKQIAKSDKRLQLEFLKGRVYLAFEFEPTQLDRVITGMPKVIKDIDRFSKVEWAKLRPLALPGPDGKELKVRLARRTKETGEARLSFSFYAFADKDLGVEVPLGSLCTASPSSVGEGWGMNVIVPVRYENGSPVKFVEYGLYGEHGVGYCREFEPSKGGE